MWSSPLLPRVCSPSGADEEASAMRRLMHARVPRGVGYLLAPLLLVLAGGLVDLARAQHTASKHHVCSAMTRRLAHAAALSAIFCWVWIAPLPAWAQQPLAGSSAPVLMWKNGGCTSWCQNGWYASPAVTDLDGDGQQ